MLQDPHLGHMVVEYEVGNEEGNPVVGTCFVLIERQVNGVSTPFTNKLVLLTAAHNFVQKVGVGDES